MRIIIGRVRLMMIKISGKIILEECSSIEAYRRGQKYYQQNRVSNLTFNEETKSC
jgi:hypothetical protein